MLPSANRLRSHEDFRATVSGGVRASRPGVVVHLRASGQPQSRAGLIVSKAVGNAVTRNRVKRQLRHLLREPLVSFAEPVDVVVRALPAAAAGVDATAVRDALGDAGRKLGRR